MTAWAAARPGEGLSSFPSSSPSAPPPPPWSETFELELDASCAPEEVVLPPPPPGGEGGQGKGGPPRRAVRRRLRPAAAAADAAAAAAAEGRAALPLLPPPLPPSGRLVASTFGPSSAASASATYSLPSCELSLEIDSLPRSLWVTLGSLEEEGEEGEEEEGEGEKHQGEEENRGGERDATGKKKFVLQLKLRRQPAGRASRRKQDGLWGAYAPCGGAITTLL